MSAADLKKGCFLKPRQNNRTCKAALLCAMLILMDDTREKLKKIEVKIRELADRL